VRGGGLYACGFAITFAVLEVGSIVEDFKQIDMLFDGQVVGFILNFIVDSFRNTLQAFMWPVDIVQFAQPWGAIGLGLAFMLFPRYLKKHVEAWLFSAADDVATNGAETKSVE
jgi:hypothetical protein